MNKKIVAICGVIGSGKNTLSRAFEQSGYVQVSFAKTLKDVVSSIFGWDRKLLEGDTPESRVFRETVDEFWSNRLGFTITPRFALQHFGTDLLRKYFDDKIWIYSLEKQIQILNSDKIIITDCRFPNELLMVKNLNGTIIEVQKELPEWYQYCKDYNFCIELGNKWEYQIPSEKYGIHSSEYSWIGINRPNFIVKNDTTAESLVQKGYDIVKELNANT